MSNTIETFATELHIGKFRVGKAGKEAAEKLERAAKYEAEAKRLKAEAKETLESLLPKEYGNKGTFQGVNIVQVARGTNKSIDYDLLAEAFPEAYARTVKLTPYVYYKTV